MRLNRRAEAGFMEALVAMMVATIALTAFMGVLVHTAAEEHPPEVSLSFLDALSVEDGVIVGIDEDVLRRECGMMGYGSMAVKVTVRLPDGPVTLKAGDVSGENLGFASGTMAVPCDDGTVVTAAYEVVVSSA